MPPTVWSVAFVGVSTLMTAPPEMHEAAARCLHWCVERGVLLTGCTCLPLLHGLLCVRPDPAAKADL